MSCGGEGREIIGESRGGVEIRQRGSWGVVGKGGIGGGVGVVRRRRGRGVMEVWGEKWRGGGGHVRRE